MLQRARDNKGWTAVILVGIGIALIISLFSPFASSSPDGLERVAEDEAFLDRAEDPSYEIIPDYTFPGVENERLATILSGIVGVIIVAAIGLTIGYGLKTVARSRSATVTTPGDAPPVAGAGPGR